MTAYGTLALLTIPQLTNLFNTNASSNLPERAKDVIAELERRGLLYDVRKGDFIDCKEWNIRHGRYAPMDCEKQARAIANS